MPCLVDWRRAATLLLSNYCRALGQTGPVTPKTVGKNGAFLGTPVGVALASLAERERPKTASARSERPLSSNMNLLALALAVLLTSSGVRAEENRTMIFNSYETRSANAFSEDISSALDFAEGDSDGLSVSAVTGHVYLAGRQNYTFGLALGQTEAGADRRHHAAVEAAVKGLGISLSISAGRRFRSTGAATFGRFSLQLPLAAGLKFVLGMEYDSLKGGEEIRLALAPAASSNTRWEPFFDAGGSGRDMHVIGGFRIFLGPLNRKRLRDSDAFDVIPNAAASEIRAQAKDGGNEEDTSSSNTVSSPPTSTPALNLGQANASTRKLSGIEQSRSHAANPSRQKPPSRGARGPKR